RPDPAAQPTLRRINSPRAQCHYHVVSKCSRQMIKAGGRGGFRNWVSGRVHSFNPESRRHAGKMPLECPQRPDNAIGPAPRHGLKPFGLGPKPKTSVRDRTIAPQPVHDLTTRRVDAMPLGELKEGIGCHLQFRIRRHAHCGSSGFIAVKQPYPFVMMARLGYEAPVLPMRRQRLIEAFRQGAFPGLEEAPDEASGKSARTSEKALAAECLARG